jgi:DNA-directed RNA polymerase subunit RPC12/RpoP
MTSITKAHDGTCLQCGSRLINLEWEEHLNPREVQHLWKCLECRKEFVTLDASKEETVTNAEIIEPFFTSLVVE